MPKYLSRPEPMPSFHPEPIKVKLGIVIGHEILDAVAERTWELFAMKEERGKDVQHNESAFSRVFHQYIGSVTTFGRLAEALNLLTSDDSFLKGGEGFLFEEAEKLLMAWASDQGKELPLGMDGLLASFSVPRYYES